MLLLDTDDLPLGDRVDAFYAVATAEAGTCGIEHELDAGHGFRKRIAAWRFGPVTLFRNQGSGMRYWQTPICARTPGTPSRSSLSPTGGAASAGTASSATSPLAISPSPANPPAPGNAAGPAPARAWASCWTPTCSACPTT
ncbi:hypothetical protein ACSDR0_14545 [Streptosporangium sp. G11]|uniref:hypothetical protein n=1 Tax=Streptosporangium sp. G11 TaxID=3436926 RepID=UPI003EB7E42E